MLENRVNGMYYIYYNAMMRYSRKDNQMLKLNEKYLRGFVTKEELDEMQVEVAKADDILMNKKGAGSDFLGWIDLPVNYDKEEFDRIVETAEKIKRMCDILVVIGIGGSYLGARAAIEFVKSQRYNFLPKDTPDIYFAGNSISSSDMAELLQICEGKNICINVISKSGKTTEPAIAFRIFRKLLEDKYGENAKDRIFVTTDKCKGKLKELSDQNGYETFVVPDDIGGRYSVLTAVGLLPIAVAGADIKAMMQGAADARKAYLDADINKNDCYKYAAIRNILYRKGKKIEVFETYESALQMTSEWWKQLYGESEGKDNKGIFPTSVTFSTDLHSLGQIIQDGERTIFGTIIDVKESNHTIIIPDDPKNADELNFISNKTMDYVNHTAFIATALAHCDGGVPNIVIEVDKRDEYNFGYLVYFFEKACGISGYILGVNPFDQPGVEGYKNNMYALLGKPGKEHDKRREELKLKIN